MALAEWKCCSASSKFEKRKSSLGIRAEREGEGDGQDEAEEEADEQSEEWEEQFGWRQLANLLVAGPNRTERPL
jgi:hypothetical protein